VTETPKQTRRLPNTSREHFVRGFLFKGTMENLLTELAKQIPNAVAVIAMAYLFLYFQKQADERREAAARDKAQEDRAHNLQVNNMWAGYIKQLVENHEESFKSIARTLADHEKASEERYEKMNITNDLIRAVKEKQNEPPKV
jgi:hypothetical protein